MNQKTKRELINKTKSQFFEIIKLCFTEYPLQELLIDVLWGGKDFVAKMYEKHCLVNLPLKNS